MILNDHYGKRCNAEKFSIEVVRGYVGNSNRETPLFILMGSYSYFKQVTVHSNDARLYQSQHILERLKATPENMEYLLNKKEMLFDQQQEINRKLKEMYNLLSPSLVNFFDDIQLIKFANGYAFKEADEKIEVDLSDNWVKNIDWEKEKNKFGGDEKKLEKTEKKPVR